MISALTRRGSSRKWRAIRAWVLRRDANVCQAVRDGHVCGAYADTVGHRLRRENGGTDDPANLEAQCGQCNYSERTPQPEVPVTPTLTQLGIARVLDTVGLPVSAGRRQALEALAKVLPANRFRSVDIDTACRWRRHRGPLTRA